MKSPHQLQLLPVACASIFILLLQRFEPAGGSFVGPQRNYKHEKTNNVAAPFLGSSIHKSSFTALSVAEPLPAIQTDVSDGDSKNDENGINNSNNNNYIGTENIDFEKIVDSSMSLSRAIEIANVLFGEVLIPICQSVSSHGKIPSSWDEFWNLNNSIESSTSDISSNAKRISKALEELGPTYVKFGQALSTRTDLIPRPLALALSSLQDNMQPFDTNQAKEIIRSELSKNLEPDLLEELVDSLSEEPIAAASIGQVYSGYLPWECNDVSAPCSIYSDSPDEELLLNKQKIAIKVQRPGVRKMVERDAALLRSVVSVLESIPAIPKLQNDQEKFIETELVHAVDEFMSRLFEELNYRNEASNIAMFSSLYSHRRLDDPTLCSELTSSSDINVVVPNAYADLCTDNVLVMEWIEGTKLLDLDINADGAVTEESIEELKMENLALLQQGIECTLSQLLDTGVMHADPHAGNLLKVHEVVKVTDGTGTDEAEDATSAATTATSNEKIETKTISRLGYVDFGLVSTIPQNVRDGLICAVAQIIFAQNNTAVADLFGELELLPDEIMTNPSELAELSKALNELMPQVLQYPDPTIVATTNTTAVPKLQFDKLLDALARLTPRFQFRLPPYTLNNARALGTLEGMAREVDPTFNVLQILYPYALSRVISNPTQNPVVEATVQSLIRDPKTYDIDTMRIKKLFDDSATITGFSRRKVLMDVLSSKTGRKLARSAGKEIIQLRFKQRINKISNYFRL